MKAGRELDALVAEKVFGVTIEWGEGTPCPYCGSEMRYCGSRSRCSQCQEWIYGPYKDYSTEMAAAWEVHKAACDWLFSERRKYFKAMQRLVSQRMGDYTIAWPDVLLFIEPADFCLAALEAKGIGVE